ncbi:Hypothetical protein P9303_06481 [Prochlorococcus marinus str. MIT 9303]|uniref:Uncharacterized protein n=1 Tax=Prochlorococcus marinus (strain MIT 9303) TaxID=59922 RepID=A2C7E0_PROM3|nr:Hypothetical protein P9303_06481 [Prochlorococcus marinus str. MIT 9303]
MASNDAANGLEQKQGKVGLTTSSGPSGLAPTEARALERKPLNSSEIQRTIASAKGSAMS